MAQAQYSDEAIAAATGRTWPEWRQLLDGFDAAKLSHKDIAAKLHAEHGVSGWWSQMLTVEYERAIGRRVVGQTCAGDFSASATRTFGGDKDAALDLWRDAVMGITAFDGVEIVGETRESSSDNWRYWRADLADGSRLSIVISDKAGGKALLAVNHDKLPDAEAVARWKAYWGPFLKAIG